MTTQLTPEELQNYQNLLQNYEPAKAALETLEAENGDLENSFNSLWQEINGVPPQLGEQSIFKVTLEVLRDEICGKDDSFRTKVQELKKNPDSTPLLTGLIVYLVGFAGIPIDPAIATIIVLYILKIGVDIFCKYTEASKYSKDLESSQKTESLEPKKED